MRLAEMSTEKFRHGAIIMKGGSVISVGVNRARNHPSVVSHPKQEAAVHAEVAAIKSARGADLRGAVIYVARVLRDGSPAMSKPCEYCQEAIAAAGIKKVFYTIDGEMDL